LSAVGGVLESVHRHVLESILRAYLGVYSKAGLQLGAFLKEYLGVYMTMDWEVVLPTGLGNLPAVRV